MAEAPIPRCNCCHTRDVAILLECHNSACSHYATPQRIYEGWHSKQAAPAAVAGPGVRRIERTYFPNSPAHRALAAFCHAMHDNNIDGADMRAAMLWFLGLEEYEEQAAEIDPATMALAESVGLIGPASRTHDLHGAIQRFHDLICANATIKAAQMAAEAISEAAPQQEPVAWANWKVGSTSYAPYRTREQAVASVNQSGIAATQEGPYEVVALYTAPQTSPAAQGDALTQAARDVLAERQRQISVEGRTPGLDDEHLPGVLALAAASYVCADEGDAPPAIWPWDWSWWKPRDRRRNLVKSGALVLAELERMDRAGAARAAQEGK